jgi:hypothetical protein
MPATAIQDMMEWPSMPTAEGDVSAFFNREIPRDQIIAGAPEISATRDDKPVNEYFLLRMGARQYWQTAMITPQ